MCSLARLAASAATAMFTVIPFSTDEAAATPTPPAAPLEGPHGLVVGGAELATAGTAVVATHPDTPVLPEVIEDAAAWIVADVDTGAVLAAQDAYVPLPPASTLKLLTALALFPLVPADIAYVATEADARVEGSRVGLVPDEVYSRADLEHGLVLASGNDAAHALAGLAGGLDAAVDLMNAEAERLGAFSTLALTPHGLDEPGQVSSAYDLALIGGAALADDAIARLAVTRTYEFPGLDGTTFQIQNQNRLLGRYTGTLGLKTGYTSDAGHTLVAAAERDGTRLVVTVLGAEGRAEPIAEDLLDWAFSVPPGAEPVGRLVSPDEAAAAVEAVRIDASAHGTHESDADSGPGEDSPDGPVDPATGQATDQDADQQAAQPTRAAPGTALWAGVGAGLLVLTSMVALRRRRRRSAGRYAA